jgi:hypothetical protein
MSNLDNDSRIERSYPMGDKGGRKDKSKNKKQKESKDAQKKRERQDKQPKSIPGEKSKSV